MAGAYNDSAATGDELNESQMAFTDQLADLDCFWIICLMLFVAQKLLGATRIAGFQETTVLLLPNIADE
jgi:hypothetical protein